MEFRTRMAAGERSAEGVRPTVWGYQFSRLLSWWLGVGYRGALCRTLKNPPLQQREQNTYKQYSAVQSNVGTKNTKKQSNAIKCWHKEHKQTIQCSAVKCWHKEYKQTVQCSAVKCWHKEHKQTVQKSNVGTKNTNKQSSPVQSNVGTTTNNVRKVQNKHVTLTQWVFSRGLSNQTFAMRE